MHRLSDRCLTSLVVVLLLFCFLGNAIAADWKVIQPVNGDRVKLKVNKKTWSYWELSHETSVKVSVTGPMTLKLYTRAEIQKKNKDVLYSFVVLEDGKDRKFLGRGSSRDKSVSMPSDKNVRIAEARSVYLDVPAGAHEYSIELPNQTKTRVFARFYEEQSSSKEEISYIPFLPRHFKDEVKVVVKEKGYIYYRATNDNPIELEIIGPTRIRGVARLEFDHHMRGNKPFRVQVRENNKIIKTQALAGVISGVATYGETSSKVIGRGENFYIDVPEGKHRIEILLPDTNVEVLFRFYIPQKDLSNGLSKK